VDEAIGRHRTQRIKMTVRGDGRSAVTHYRIEKKFRAHTLARVRLETGRTHQIRVHAAHAGHPLAGDAKYGDAEFNAKMKAMGLGRMFLHAHQVSFVWPDSGVEFSVNAPLPADLAGAIDALGAERR
jgi:23S rRNA-/tRNA-specific pseudouridylate synthase